MFNNNEIADALDQIDMEFWLEREGASFRLTRGSHGPQINVKECPCCGNSNWKVYLNQEKGIGNCFVCEKKFNKWRFIEASLGGLTKREVVDHIKAVAKEQGWRPKVVKSMAVNMKTDLILPNSIALPHNGRNLKYLTNRGINKDVTQYFSLRFSKNGYFDYFDVEGEKRRQKYDNRIIIPVFDALGDLVTFQGRDITGVAARKYLFPPGFASTGSLLYNHHNAHGAKHIVIGEGVFDVMAIKIALDEESAFRDIVPIGSFGKHLSGGDEASQVHKLLQLKTEGLETVTFMWDGEDKAIDAAIEAALNLRKYGLKAKVAILSKDKDPNEVTPQEVRDALWRATLIDTATAATLKVKKSIT